MAKDIILQDITSTKLQWSDHTFLRFWLNPLGFQSTARLKDTIDARTKTKLPSAILSPILAEEIGNLNLLVPTQELTDNFEQLIQSTLNKIATLKTTIETIHDAHWFTRELTGLKQASHRSEHKWGGSSICIKGITSLAAGKGF